MIPTTPFKERLDEIFKTTPCNVTGFVDDLLELARQFGLKAFYQDGICLIRPLRLAPPDWSSFPLQRSVFRAALARIACLCNEWVPDSVTPYGGVCVQPSEINSHYEFHVSFTNTSSELRLEASLQPNYLNSSIPVSRVAMHSVNDAGQRVPKQPS